MTTERLTIDLQEEVLEEFSRDRHLAHDLLFAHRHPVDTAPFQLEMIDLIHSRDTLACIVAFRDSAKSTYAEEAVVLMACLREFSHGLIVGTSL
ncbi:MAG TPA: hypothetical protein VNG04_06050, partial [Candidatus Acidoferrum sp.]|nr:hypothetical protein [Candidatus Acidoferrum sp.]